MEGEGVFELVTSRYDEYPGDGLRLVLTASSNTPKLRGEALAGGGPTTEILRLLGFTDLKDGDEVLIHAKLLTRVVTRREPV